MEPPAIWSHFESLKDPRVERTRRQQLIDIVIISVLAVVAGADGWSDIVQFAEDRQDWWCAPKAGTHHEAKCRNRCGGSDCCAWPLLQLPAAAAGCYCRAACGGGYCCRLRWHILRD